MPSSDPPEPSALPGGAQRFIKVLDDVGWRWVVSRNQGQLGPDKPMICLTKITAQPNDGGRGVVATWWDDKFRSGYALIADKGGRKVGWREVIDFVRSPS